jgi:hypothetical protein
MRKPLTITGAALLIAMTVACGTGTTSKAGSSDGGAKTTTEEQTQAATAAVGSPITLNSSLLGSKSQVVITIKSVKITPNGANDFDAPKGEYVLADIVIECKSGTYHANPFNFALVGADGTKVNPAMTLFNPALNAIDLNGGQKASGLVAFDVPKGTGKTSKIVVSDPVGNKDAATWTM